MSEEFENINENPSDDRKEEFKAKVEDMKSEVKQAYENVKDQAQDDDVLIAGLVKQEC